MDDETYDEVEDEIDNKKKKRLMWLLVPIVLYTPVYYILAQIIFNSRTFLNGGVAELKGRIFICEALPVIFTAGSAVFVMITVRSIKQKNEKTFFITTLICITLTIISYLFCVSPRFFRTDIDESHFKTYSDDIKILLRSDKKNTVSESVSDLKPCVLTHEVEIKSRGRSSGVDLNVYSITCFNKKNEKLDIYIFPSQYEYIHKELDKCDSNTKYTWKISYDPDFMVLTDFPECSQIGTIAGENGFIE